MEECFITGMNEQHRNTFEETCAYICDSKVGRHTKHFLFEPETCRTQTGGCGSEAMQLHIHARHSLHNPFYVHKISINRSNSR